MRRKPIERPLPPTYRYVMQTDWHVARVSILLEYRCSHHALQPSVDRVPQLYADEIEPR